MEKLFWDSFCNTGQIDMYMLYKDYKKDQEIKNPSTVEEKQSSPTTNTEWGLSLS